MLPLRLFTRKRAGPALCPSIAQRLAAYTALGSVQKPFFVPQPTRRTDRRCLGIWRKRLYLPLAPLGAQLNNYLRSGDCSR